jgi:broad specificity phosphatase PhoE
MGTLYLVRHGQASFGAANYDQLSVLGQRQCVRLGEYFRSRGRRFQAVITGTLTRHGQSWDALAAGLGDAAPPGEPLRLAELNEYDSAAVIAAVHPAPLERPTTREQYREHFRILQRGLAGWIDGSTSPHGMPRYEDFAAGIRATLAHVRTRHDGEVLIVSSGGPIATAVIQVLGAPPATSIDLNMRMRNSAVTEFAFTPKRHMLVSFNTLPHLDDPDWADAVTFM